MTFKQTLQWAWLYRKRHFRRLLGFELQSFLVYTLMIIFWNVLSFFFRFSYLTNSKQINLYEGADNITMSAYQQAINQLMTMKVSFEVALWLLLIGLGIFTLVSHRLYLRMEFTFDQSRLAQTYSRFADSRQLTDELLLSRFICQPITFVLSALTASVLSYFAILRLINSLSTRIQLFAPALSVHWLFLLFMTSLIVLHIGYLRHSIHLKIQNYFLNSKE